jgi:O-antigen ligase
LGAGRLRAPARAALMAVLGLAVVALVLTFTRGAWLALFFSFIVFVFLKTSLPKLFFFIVIALIILGCLFPFVQKRFADVSGGGEEEMSSWEWRLQQWRRTVSRIGEYPWIGHGLGMYERDFRIMAHNDYLRISYETGLLGLFWYVVFFGYLLASSLMKAIRTRDPSMAQARKTAGCLVLAFLAMSVADNLARSTVIVIAYLSMIGSLFSSSAEAAGVAPAAGQGKMS